MGNLCQLRFHRDIEKSFWEGGLFFLFIFRLEISCWKFYERYSLFNRNVRWINFQHRCAFNCRFAAISARWFCKTSYAIHLPPLMLSISSIFHHISSLCFYSLLTNRIYNFIMMHALSRLCRTHKQCKQKRPYCLEIDISNKDTLHTLTKPREKDGTENLARHTHDTTWQTPGYIPPHPILRMDQDIKTQEEHLHLPSRGLANHQPRIYKTT